MSIQTRTTADLLYALQRQYPSGVTTIGVCAAGCGNSARGGGWCAECIGAELMRRGANQKTFALALASLVSRSYWAAKAEEAIEVLREQVEAAQPEEE